MTKAFACALRLLARREHSVFELKNKLKQKGYGGSELEDAISECQRLHYQSDERFTAQCFNARIRQGYGPLRIQQELIAKGISDDLIDQLFAQQDEFFWLECARRVSQKKSVDQTNMAWDEQQKLKRFLLYRGFSVDIITQLFR